MHQHNITSPKPPPPPLEKGHAISTRALSSTPTWILDSGASHHMKHSPDLVTSLVQSVTTQITVGNFAQLLILGLGTISFKGGSL